MAAAPQGVLAHLTPAQRRATAGAFAHAFSVTCPTNELHVWARRSFFRDLVVDKLDLTQDDYKAIEPIIGSPPITPNGADSTASRTCLEPQLSAPVIPFLDGVASDVQTRTAVLLALVMQYLVTGTYDARVRATFIRVARLWGLPAGTLGLAEDRMLPLAAAQAAQGAGAHPAAPPGSSAASASGSSSISSRSGRSSGSDSYRWLKVGAASLAGAGLLLATGGAIAVPLLLPALGALGASLGVGAVTGTAVAFFTGSAAGSALLLTLFGSAGGGLAAYKAARKTAGLGVFRFLPLTALPAQLQQGQGQALQQQRGSNSADNDGSRPGPGQPGTAARSGKPPLASSGSSASSGAGKPGSRGGGMGLPSSLNPFSWGSGGRKAQPAPGPPPALTPDGLVASSDDTQHRSSVRDRDGAPQPAHFPPVHHTTSCPPSDSSAPAAHRHTHSAFELLPRPAEEDVTAGMSDSRRNDVTGIDHDRLRRLSLDSRSDSGMDDEAHSASVSAARAAQLSLMSVSLGSDGGSSSGGGPDKAMHISAAGSSAVEPGSHGDVAGYAPGLHVFVLVSGTAADGSFQLAKQGATATPRAGGSPLVSALSKTSGSSPSQSPGPVSTSPVQPRGSVRVDELTLTAAALPGLTAAQLAQCGPFTLPWGGIANATTAFTAPSEAGEGSVDASPDKTGEVLSSSPTDAVDGSGEGGDEGAVFYDSDADEEDTPGCDLGAAATAATAPLTDEVELQELDGQAISSPFEHGAPDVTTPRTTSPAEASITDVTSPIAPSAVTPSSNSASPVPAAGEATQPSTPPKKASSGRLRVRNPLRAVGGVIASVSPGTGAGKAPGVRAGWFRRSLASYGEAYALVYEPDVAARVSRYVSAFMLTTLTNQAVSHVLAHTALGALLAAWQLPALAVNALSFIDAPWSMATSRADKAAVALAEALASGAHGRRPVTLVGWGFGARVIFKALELLDEAASAQHADSDGSAHHARRRGSASEPAAAAASGDGSGGAGSARELEAWDPSRASPHGGGSSGGGTAPAAVRLPAGPLPPHAIVQDAFLFGIPTPTTAERWASARRVVSGRLVNGYCAGDFVLRFVYRSSSLHAGIAGLGPVGEAPAATAAPTASPQPDITAADRAPTPAPESATPMPVPSANDASAPAAAAAAAPPPPAPRVTWWRGVESVDVSSVVNGHLDYASRMHDLLQLVRMEQ